MTNDDCPKNNVLLFTLSLNEPNALCCTVTNSIQRDCSTRFFYLFFFFTNQHPRSLWWRVENIFEFCFDLAEIFMKREHFLLITLRKVRTFRIIYLERPVFLKYKTQKVKNVCEFCTESLGTNYACKHFLYNTAKRHA